MENVKRALEAFAMVCVGAAALFLWQANQPKMAAEQELLIDPATDLKLQPPELEVIVGDPVDIHGQTHGVRVNFRPLDRSVRIREVDAFTTSVTCKKEGTFVVQGVSALVVGHDRNGNPVAKPTNYSDCVLHAKKGTEKED